MTWTDEDILCAMRDLPAGYATAKRMLEAFAAQRSRDIKAARVAGRECVLCGMPILRGEDYIGLP